MRSDIRTSTDKIATRVVKIMRMLETARLHVACLPVRRCYQRNWCFQSILCELTKKRVRSRVKTICSINFLRKLTLKH